MPVLQYAAVIRAYQCTPMLQQVIGALRDQSVPPQEIIIVDSSRNDETSAAFSELGARVVPYPPGEFNFSRAINVGVEANPHPYTLIISSHVIARAPGLIEQGWKDARMRSVDVAYWASDPDAKLIVTPRNFTGRNGLSNSAALISTPLLRSLPFREEVFSAEDQEWAKRYFRTCERGILRIQTKGLEYLNPNHGNGAWSETKLLNEELAIGHFVKRRFISPDKIAARIFRGVLATVRRRPDRAKMHFGHAWAMTKANFLRPGARSKYF